MKKGSKKFKASDLIVDVLEYAFTEWLVRQGLFVAFKANYDVVVSPYGCFRDHLRAHIRRSLCSPSLTLPLSFPPLFCSLRRPRVMIFGENTPTPGSVFILDSNRNFKLHCYDTDSSCYS